MGWRSLSGLSQRDNRISFDYIALMWHVTAVVLTLYIGLVTVDLAVKVKVLFGVAMGTVGLFSGVFLGYISLDLQRKLSIIDWLGGSLLGATAILLINFTVNFGASVFRFAVTWDVALAFVVSMAVFEEDFFRPFLLPLFTKTFRVLPGAFGEFVGVMIVSAIGAIFHFGVYALDPVALLVVFGAWMVLNYLVLFMKRISVTMTSHALINALSMITFAVIGI